MMHLSTQKYFSTVLPALYMGNVFRGRDKFGWNVSKCARV